MELPVEVVGFGGFGHLEIWMENTNMNPRGMSLGRGLGGNMLESGIASVVMEDRTKKDWTTANFQARRCVYLLF